MSWIRLSHLGDSGLTQAGAPRPCQPHGSEEKEEKKGKIIKLKQKKERAIKPTNKSNNDNKH